MKRKTSRIVIINFVIVISVLFGGTAYAQDGELPNPGVTPDSPFYFLDHWGKNIGLFFAFGPEAKARKALEYAEERLAEVQAMAAKNRLKEVKRATNGYDKFVAISTEKAEETSQQGVSDDVPEIVALATLKHLSVLDKVKDSAPEEIKEVIAQAKEVSITGREKALKALAIKKPERAIEINLATIEDRLYRADAKADENNTEEVEDAIDDTKKLFKLGEELSEIARGLGKDSTTIEQLIAKATSNHLQVLARVYEKAPEQAKPAIEQAIANSVKDQERIMEALKKRGIPYEVIEKTLIPKRVTEEVKARLTNLQPVVRKYQASENKVEEKDEEREREENKERLLELRPKVLNQENTEDRIDTSAEDSIEQAEQELRKVMAHAEEAIEQAEQKLRKVMAEAKEDVEQAEQELREVKAYWEEAVEQAEQKLREAMSEDAEVK